MIQVQEGIYINKSKHMPKFLLTESKLCVSCRMLISLKDRSDEQDRGQTSSLTERQGLQVHQACWTLRIGRIITISEIRPIEWASVATTMSGAG